jgi:hypothetical protein
MKDSGKLLLLLLILSSNAALASNNPEPGGNIATEYSKARDITTIKMDDLILFRQNLNEIRLSSIVESRGSVLAKAPSRIVLQFSTQSYVNPLFSEVSELSAWSDGELLPLGSAVRLEGKLVGSMYMEQLITTINYRTFMKVVVGNELELKLHNTRFKVSNEQLEALRAYARSIHPQ